VLTLVLAAWLAVRRAQAVISVAVVGFPGHFRWAAAAPCLLELPQPLGGVPAGRFWLVRICTWLARHSVRLPTTGTASGLAATMPRRIPLRLRLKHSAVLTSRHAR